MKEIHPIYVDGPFEGQDFPTAPGCPVQAIDYSDVDASSILAGTATAPIVTYELRQFAFHSGGKAVSFWIGSCSPGEPDAVTVFRALCKPEFFDRAETRDMPASRATASQQRSDG